MTDSKDSEDIKIIQCFDFDGVLFDFLGKWVLFDNAKPILESLKSKGYTMALVSARAANSEYSEQIMSVLKEQKIDHYFNHIVIQYTPKTYHLMEVMEITKSDKLVLYDDTEQNIKDCEAYGHKCVKINPNKGIQFDDIVY